MKIPKRRESKTKNSVQKRADIFMRVMLVFMTFFFIGVFICIIIFNLKRDKPDNKHKDTPNVQDKSSNVVNIEENTFLPNNKQQTNISSFINDTIGIYAKTFLKGEFCKHENEHTKTTVGKKISQIEKKYKLSEKIYNDFSFISFSTNFLSEKNNQDSMTTMVKIDNIYVLMGYLPRLIDCYNRITLLYKEEKSHEIDNLEIYVNYMILYEGVYGVSKVLNSVIKDNKEYKEKVENNLKEIPKIDEFIESYTQILKDLMADIYTETKVVVPPFKDSNNDDAHEHTTTIFLIKDFDKAINLVLLTFYQVYLYIFTYDNEKQKIMLSAEVINLKKNKKNASLEILDKKTMEINNLCSDLFRINIKDLGDELLSSNKSFKDFFESIESLMG